MTKVYKIGWRKYILALDNIKDEKQVKEIQKSLNILFPKSKILILCNF